jgi:hypothetical protein
VRSSPIPLLIASLIVCSQTANAETGAQTRAPPPNPASGESYDGKTVESSPAKAALWVPRVLLFPFRLLFWALEPPSRLGVEFEQEHHLYGHLYSALTSDDGQIGIRPTFHWVNSFRPSFGAHVFDDKLLGPGTRSDFDILGGVDVFRAAVHLRPTHLGRPVQGYFDTLFDRRNDWLFTGIGSHAPLPPNSSARYLQDRFDLGMRLDLRPTPVLAFTFGGYFGWRHFDNGEAYSGDPPISQVYCRRFNGECIPNTVSDIQVPGFNQGTQFLRTSAGVHLDLRDDLIRPTVGALIDAEADYSHGIGDDESNYFRLRGAAAFSINLWRHRYVLIFRGVTELVLPVESFVPFSELATLGGPEDLRGFRVQEFRDFSSLLGTAEYRFPLLAWVDTSIFADYGGVFGEKYQGFGASRMQPDVGFGFRLHTRDRFYIKLQFAYGFDGGGWQIYLTGQNLP